ncbi:uncharacterized protein HD556DRAFT_898090 [Suillus plorans]|uniref:Uncharacterized protein n=1 Tax=Suillus plorans TaxID=116603 RepID=A0A9P7DS74_9AGAM|nr:uncharacterized protein HD556DRAFT_898090 [Suillus plorans]KAG1801654.1 hypothetical protein HD556DRAFT_898090 [Suillus plorans]
MLHVSTDRLHTLNVLTISVTHVVSNIMTIIRNLMNIVVFAMLGIIMHHDPSVTRHISGIHKDADVSRSCLLGCQDCHRSDHRDINIHISKKKYSFCPVPIRPITITFEEDDLYLFSMTSMLTTAWEVLTLSRSLDCCQKHFRKMQRLSKGWIIGDCFMALMKSHIVYFASFGLKYRVSVGVLLRPSIFLCWDHIRSLAFDTR